MASPGAGARPRSAGGRRRARWATGGRCGAYLVCIENSLCSSPSVLRSRWIRVIVALVLSYEEKCRLVAELIADVRQELAAATAAQQATQQGATHEESRPENDKDTRATESSYLARGQARRVAELAEALASLSAMPIRRFGPDEPVALSAWVEVESEQGTRGYLLAPAGGGARIECGGHTVSVLTPASPLGRALLGQRAGASVELRKPSGNVELELLRVL